MLYFESHDTIIRYAIMYTSEKDVVIPYTIISMTISEEEIYMFNLNFAINDMNPTTYLRNIVSGNNIKHTTIKHHYLKYVEHWIDNCFPSCKDRSKVDKLKHNVLEYVDTFKFYDLFTMNDISQSFCTHNIVYKNGAAVSTYMHLRHIGCILKFETTFFLNDPEEVMLNVTKDITSADITTVDLLRDPAKLVNLSNGYMDENYRQVAHNLETLIIVKKAIKYLNGGKEVSNFNGEELYKSYQNRYGAFLYTYMKPEMREQFAKTDKDGQIIGFECDKILDGKISLKECMPTDKNGDVDCDIYDELNYNINNDCHYEVVVDNNHMIQIDQIYETIAQYYIDNLLYESYDVFAFLTQNKCSNNEILTKTAQLINKHHNHKIDFINYLNDNEPLQYIVCNSDDITEEVDKKVTSLINTNDMDPNIKAEYLLRKIDPNFDNIIGYKQVYALYTITSQIINNMVTSKLSSVTPIVTPNDLQLMEILIKEIIDKYKEIRKSYGIHCTVNNMRYLYNKYLSPINNITSSTFDTLSAFDDMNYTFEIDDDNE